jgi:hypothetical protein
LEFLIGPRPFGVDLQEIGFGFVLNRDGAETLASLPKIRRKCEATNCLIMPG